MARIRPRLTRQIRRKTRLTSSVAAAAALLVSIYSVAASDVSAPHVRHFAQVDEAIYRGGEPSEAGLRDLAALHVKLVVDLREKGSGTKREEAEVEALGMEYRNFPLRSFSAPSVEQIDTLLAILSNKADLPVFVHCWRGKDRTGTVIACYRIRHDGWSNARALKEANSHGLSYAERGMRSFILHFPAMTPVAAETPGPVAAH